MRRLLLLVAMLSLVLAPPLALASPPDRIPPIPRLVCDNQPNPDPLSGACAGLVAQIYAIIETLDSTLEQLIDDLLSLPGETLGEDPVGYAQRVHMCTKEWMLHIDPSTYDCV